MAKVFELKGLTDSFGSTITPTGSPTTNGDWVSLSGGAYLDTDFGFSEATTSDNDFTLIVKFRGTNFIYTLKTKSDLLIPVFVHSHHVHQHEVEEKFGIKRPIHIDHIVCFD